MEKEWLEECISLGLSTRGIAERSSKSQSNIRFWLSKYNLKTTKNRYNAGSSGGTHNNTNNTSNPIHKDCEICGGKTKGRKICPSCGVSIRRTRAKIASVRYLGSKCKRCGWEGSVEEYAAYEFHHDGIENKDFEIGSVSNKSWDVIRKELDKCTLLCSRCHRIEHSSRFRSTFIERALKYNGRTMMGLVGNLLTDQ